MSSASVRFGTKAYVCARYFLRPGKCFKYIDQRGEDTTEHIYEVMAQCIRHFWNGVAR